MEIGNVLLMLFIIYCNCTLIKLVGEQTGVEIDLLKQQVTDLQDEVSKSTLDKIKKQTTALNLQKNASDVNMKME